MKKLGQSKCDNQKRWQHPKYNFAFGVPTVDASTKTDCHNKSGHGSGEDNDAEPVSLLRYSLHERDFWINVDTREKEQVSRWKYCAYDKIDIEGLL